VDLDRAQSLLEELDSPDAPASEIQESLWRCHRSRFLLAEKRKDMDAACAVVDKLVRFGPQNERQLISLLACTVSCANLLNESEDGVVLQGKDEKKQALLEQATSLLRKLATCKDPRIMLAAKRLLKQPGFADFVKESPELVPIHAELLEKKVVGGFVFTPDDLHALR
jgi:hypothetical protein